MKKYGRLAAALDALGATLKREKKHLVYELPNGRSFVVAKSPSDSRGELNALSDLEAVAGVAVIDRPRKASADVRAERSRRPGRRESDEARWKSSGAVAAALSESGVMAERLTLEVEQLRGEIAMLQTANVRLERWLSEKDSYIAQIHGLWPVRVWLWWRA